jgi:hypothetical protein
MGKLTVIKTRNPISVGKTFTIENGELVKRAGANVFEGVARTVEVPDAAAMVELLEKVTARTDLVLVNGVFRGADTSMFGIVTAKRLEAIVKAEGGDYGEVLATGRVYTLKTGPDAGRQVAARLKALQDPSGWLLLDADEPEGFPDDWRTLSFQERLELLEPYARGLSSAERVELRGSSARVVRDGGSPKPASHGWVQIDDPEDVARSAVALGIHAVAGNSYFSSPRYSRTTGEQIGTSARTSIDLATWHRGRLNFDSRPTVMAEGYSVTDAGIAIINRGGGLFRPGGVAPVTQTEISQYREKTGHAIVLSNRGTSATATIYGQLKMETPIEAQGETRTLAALVAHMDKHGLDKLRCEAPFRASTSESAFIGFSGGMPFVFDIGIATQYRLAPEVDDVSEVPDHEVQFDDPKAVVDGVVPRVKEGDEVGAPVTVEDVKRADIATAEGVAIVERYRGQELDRLNRMMGFAVVEGRGTIVRVGRNGIGELGVQFIGIDAESNRLANELVPEVVGGQNPRIQWSPIFKRWLQWRNRRTYDGVVFEPKREVLATRRLPPASRDGLKPLNLFVGTAWVPAPGACSLLLQHIREVWCGGQEEATEYVMNWLARMVQQPELPAETVLVLRSGQGIGKGTITNIFRRYFGAHGIEITNDRELTGFNDHLSTAIFVSLNEACWGGNKQSEGTLKSLITEHEISVERKFLPLFKIRNRTHLIVSSNSDWAVPVGHDDRRFAVLNPAPVRRDTAYFRALHDEIQAGGDRALIHHLLQRDITGFDPRVLPKVAGDAKLEQKIRTANSVARWLYGLLQDNGVELVEEDALGSSRSEIFVELDAAPISKTALYKAYVASTRGDHPEALELWSKTLRNILGSSVKSVRHRSGYRPRPRHSSAAQVPCFEFLAPELTRAAFAKYMNEHIEW